MIKHNKTLLSDDEHIAKARFKLTELNLTPDDILPKLLDKFGALAYDFILQALATPAQITERAALPFMSAQSLIGYFAFEKLSDETLACAIDKTVGDISDARMLYRKDVAQTNEKIKQTEMMADYNNNRFAERLKTN